MTAYRTYKPGDHVVVTGSPDWDSFEFSGRVIDDLGRWLVVESCATRYAVDREGVEVVWAFSSWEAARDANQATEWDGPEGEAETP